MKKFRVYWRPPLHVIIHNGATQRFENTYTPQSSCPHAEKHSENTQTLLFPAAHLKLILFSLLEGERGCFYLISSLLNLAAGSGNVLRRGVGVVSNDAWQRAVFVWISPSLSPLESGRLKARASCPWRAHTAQIPLSPPTLPRYVGDLLHILTALLGPCWEIRFNFNIFINSCR